MSKVEVDQVDPQSGTTLTLGTSGDTVSIPSGVTLANAGTVTGIPASAISSGTIATARLGSGTASSSTFLRGDQTYAEAGGGKVLQVVTATTTSAVTNTSGSSLSSGLSASITPASSSNKILVMSSSSISTFGDGSNSSGRQGQVILYRGTTADTNIREVWVGINMISASTSTNDNPRNEVSCIVLDEPSTTSAQTYTVAIAGSGACDITAQADSNRSNIVLLEIAG